MESQLFGNVTTSFSWVSNPTTRGSANILISCITTITLSVWTAVHLNIPEDGNPQYLGLAKQMWRKIGWIFIGLFAPELLIYTAWYQRMQAKKLMKAYNKGFGLDSTKREAVSQKEPKDVEEPPLSPLKGLRVDQERHRWTLAQGFYAYMGGFVLDPASEAVKTHHLPQVRMKMDGLMMKLLLEIRAEYILRADRLMEDTHAHDEGRNRKPTSSTLSDLTQAMNISTEELYDKSKADGFAKAVICLQALWFCVQCVARLAQRLPLSLLEANTAAHAVGALTTYVLWWKKPLDIQFPTVLRIDDSDKVEIWALILKALEASFQCLKGRGCISGSSGDIAQFAHGRHLVLSGEVDSLERYDAVRTSGDQDAVPGVFIRNPIAPDIGYWWPSGSLNLPNHDEEYGRGLFEARKTSLGWELHTTHSCSCQLSEGNRFRTPNFPRLKQLRTPGVLLVFVLLTLVYGGLHALAWNADFPSDIQRLLWRISSVILIGAGTFYLACVFLKLFCQASGLFSNCTWFPGGLIDTAMEIIMWLLVIAYPFVRIYLVVECFIQVFHLPPGPFFTQPAWSSYFPHIG